MATEVQNDVLSEAEEIIEKAQRQARKQESTRVEARETRQKPLTAEQWVEKFEQRLGERVAQLSSPEVRGKPIESLGRNEVRALLEALDIAEVEELLQELQKVKESPEAATRSARVAHEVVLYERQLKAVADEKTQAAKTGEARNIIAASKGALEEQVFDNFAKFLGKGAQVHYGGDKLRVEMTNDGVYIITVPEPTFENMLSLAQLMSPEAFAGEMGENYPDQLMQAALLLDQQGIFSNDAIEELYNMGYRLKRIIQAKKGKSVDEDRTKKPFTLKEIQGMSRRQPREVLNAAYRTLILGKHDLDIRFTDEGELILQREKNSDGSEKRDKLYDALFKGWVKSNEGRAWIQANGEDLKLLRDPDLSKEERRRITEKITKAYDAWLVDSRQQSRTLRIIKRFIEAKVLPESSEDRHFSVLLAHWRHLLGNTETMKTISRQIDDKIAERGTQTTEQKLRIIAGFFQPDQQVPPEALKYLPADVLEVFQNPNSTDKQRREAACIIADSYVKGLLQERGFSVFTNLQGLHTRLIAVDKKTGEAYFVDPNRPGDEGVTRIPDSERELLDELREFSERKQEWSIKRNVNFRTEKHGLIIDGNKVYVSGIISNMLEEDQSLSSTAKYIGAKQAIKQLPENHAAWVQLVKYAPTEAERAKALLQLQRLDPQLAERVRDNPQEKMLIGAWTPAVPAGNPHYDSIVAQANAEITANGGGIGAGLDVLSAEELDELRRLIIQEIRTSGITPAPVFAVDMLTEVIDAFDAKQKNRPPQLFTPLTPGQIDVLMNKDSGKIRQLTEAQVHEVSREISTGAYLNQNAQQSIQDKLQPVRQYLEARLSLEPPGPIQESIRKERDYAVRVIELYHGLTNVVGLIQSGDPKKIEQAIDLANQMDTQGGLIVFHTVATLHEGRPMGLVSDFRREMKRTMQKNFQQEINAGRPGKYYLTMDDYLRLSQTIINQQIAYAMAGNSPYSKFRQDPNDPAHPLPAADQEQAVREQITMDIKIAQMLFEATGEASALYIQGRFPDNIYDGGAMRFLNAQWQNLSRYFEITPQNKEVAKLQFENACRIHLGEVKEEETKRIIGEMLKDKDLFDKYIEANALNILAPQVNFWWENRFLRTIPMVKSLISYEDALTPGSAALYQSKRMRDDKESKDIDVPVGGNPEFGILLRAFLYMGKEPYGNVREDALDLLLGKAADYFPDILIEPFSTQAGTGYTEKGVDADKRFIALFNSEEGRFLDASLGIAGQFKRVEQENIRHAATGQPLLPLSLNSELQLLMDELVLRRLVQPGTQQYGIVLDYQRAIMRFQMFQDYYRPKMDVIRNKRINNVEGDPVQTNFALDNTIVSAQQAYTDIYAMFGANTADFQKFIAVMQQAVRGTGFEGRDGMAYALAEDPMFENQHNSPMALIDVPMWMLDGDDLATSNPTDTNADVRKVSEATRQNALRLQLGGNDRVGRQFRDVLELGEKTRAGLIQFLKANPNNTEQIFKIIDQMADGIRNTRGTPGANELYLMIVAEYFKDMMPGGAGTFADLLGLGSAHLFKNTKYRKIMGELINSYGYEEVFSMVESKIMPTLSEEHRKRLRIILRITRLRRTSRTLVQLILMLLLSTVLQTTGSILGVLNEGVSKGAA